MEPNFIFVFMAYGISFFVIFIYLIIITIATFSIKKNQYLLKSNEIKKN